VNRRGGRGRAALAWSAAALLAALAAGPAVSAVRQALAEAQVETLAEAADDNFGWSVAVAGDVNGDGIDDFIIGAIYNDSAAKDAGKAYVYLGGSPPSPAPFVTMTGLAANDQFGVSVDGAGDMNGDGYDDVIVGARLNSLAAASAGAAFVYHGGAAMDGEPDLVLQGEAAHDWFGNAVAGAGDVNGDGHADVLVGAPYNDRSGSAAGAAYLFHGGPLPDNVPDVILAGEMHDDQFGWSVAGARDTDGDGYADLLVGARLHCVDNILCDGSTYARGRAYLYRGGRSMDAVPDVNLDGDAANDWFGQTVAGIGDINGDGRADFAVGAVYADPVAGGAVLTAAGTTSVYFGGSPVDGLRDFLLAGDQANSQSGWAIAAAGDVDGDGHGDLWTTAHFYDDGLASGAGRISLFAGGRTPPRLLASAVGEGQDVQLGHAMAGGWITGRGRPAAGLAGQVYSRDAGTGSGKAIAIWPFCVWLDPGAQLFSWASCLPFDSYNLYRGSVRTDLPAGAYGDCLYAGISGDSTAMDPATPSPGDAFLYLLTGRRGDLEGALGFGSSGALRRNTSPCP
jgi:hypothetical protein